MTSFNHSEDKIQADCFAYLWNSYPSTRRLFFHVPNQGAKNKIEGVKLKAMGVVAGIPDCVLIHPTTGRAYGFEFKSAKGTTSAIQDSVHEAWERVGAPVYVVRSVEEFRLLIYDILNK